MAEERKDVKLSELTDQQLEDKITKLNRIVYSSNSNLARQAFPVLQEMLDEQGRRNSQKFDQHLANSGVKIDEIINIG